MNAVIEGVRKKFEAERATLAQAARRREQELMEQMSYQTAAVQQRAEEEAENILVETISSVRQAAGAANNQSVDAKAACAAVAAARIKRERPATARAEHDKHELQDQLSAARLEVANTQIVAATISDQNNQHRREI
eukprot:739910-Pyramimonas_sp.AAC.1